MNVPEPTSLSPAVLQKQRRRTYLPSRPDLLLALVLALLPCLFFWRLITPNPADRRQIREGDFTEQYFPLRAFTAEAWVQGHMPLWNPYLYGGQPALADIQSGALYPPHLLQALLLGWGGPLLGREIGFPLEALEWQVILHFSIAGVGTYGFVRHLARRNGFSLRQARFGGLIASLVFTYGGYLTGFPVQQVTILETSAWLPWVLWGLDGAVGWVERRETQHPQGSGGAGEQRSGEAEGTSYAPRTTDHGPRPISKPLLAASLAFALAILAGHPQTVMYIFYLTLVYTLFWGFRAWRQEKVGAAGGLRVLGDSLLRWGGMILLGVAITAAQLLPTLEFIAYSVRAELSYPAVSAGLPLVELIAILYPGFLGGSPEYVGITTLVLIALAFLPAWSLGRGQTLEVPRQGGQHLGERAISRSLRVLPEILFWVGAGLVSLLLAFGGNLFVYPLFYLFAPGFDAVRQQERIFLIYSFSAAVLAGYGAIFLSGPLPRTLARSYQGLFRRLRQVGLVALGLTAFYLYGSAAATARGDEVNLFYGVLWHHLFGLLMLGGMLLILALRSRRWWQRGWGMGLITAWVAFNLFTVNWQFNLEAREQPTPFVPDGVTQFLQSHLAETPGRVASGGLLPGGSSAASVYHLQDLTGNTPLHLAQVDLLLQQMPAWRLWQLLNVRYVLDQRDIGDAGLQPVFAEGERQVFQMGDPFERAWLVSEVKVIPGEGEALARLAADDFDLRQAAVTDTPLELSLAESATSTVTLTDFEPNGLSLALETGEPQLLVISQIYYPGWQAELDGQPVDLLRVNLVQQGVLIPSGSHLIRLTFWPASFVMGVVISAITLLGWGILWITGGRGWEARKREISRFGRG